MGNYIEMINRLLFYKLDNKDMQDKTTLDNKIGVNLKLLKLAYFLIVNLICH
jgi:hypothetical protein